MGEHRRSTPSGGLDQGDLRQLGVRCNTARRALRREGPPAHRRAAARSKLDPYQDYLLSRLAEFPGISAAVLCDEIRAQGYAREVILLKDFMRAYRQRRREPAVHFETPLMRQTSTAVVSLLAAWARMSTIWASVYLVCFKSGPYSKGRHWLDAGAEIGGHPSRIMTRNDPMIARDNAGEGRDAPVWAIRTRRAGTTLTIRRATSGT